MLAAATGIAGLIGWWLNLPLATGQFRDRPAMMPNTAVGMIVTAFAAWLSISGQGSPWRRIVGRLFAVGALGLGVVTAIEHLLGWDPGLDRALLPGRELPGTPAGRPARGTALSFALLGAAIVFLDVGRRIRPSEILVLAVGSIAFISLTGHLYGATLLYQHGAEPSIGMAVQTALGFLALSSAVALARPDCGLMSVVTSPLAGGRMARILLPPTFAGLPLIGVLTAILRQTSPELVDRPTAFASLAVAAVLIGALLLLAVARLLNRSEASRIELVQRAPDGIFVADLDGHYTDVNDSGVRLLRSTRDKIIGRKILDILRREDHARLRSDQGRLARGESVRGEWLLRRDDGSFFPADVSANVLSDGRWLGFVRDITERKRAEQEILRARSDERRLRELLARVGDASQAVSEAVAALPRSDVNTVLQTLVLQARAVTGAQYAALGVGSDPETPFEPWVHVGVAPGVSDAIGRSPRPVGTLGMVARTATVVRSSDVGRHPAFVGLPQGHPELSSFLGVPIRYAGRTVGNLYLANKLGADEFTPEDEHAVEMLATRVGAALETAHTYRLEAQTRVWLQAVIDQIPEGVVIADEQAGTISLNRAASALTAEGVLGPWGQPIPLDLRDADGRRVDWWKLPLAEALAEGATCVGRELVIHAGDARRVPVLASAAPIPDKGAVMVLQDVSVLKQLERLREEWMSVVAHDLRQPVLVIAMSAGLLANLDLPPGALTAIRNIGGSARRLDTMIGDLLDTSAIEARRLPLSTRAVDPVALVREIVDRAASVLTDNEVAFEIEGDIQAVEVDPHRIEQVLVNLLSNAVKYGTAGSTIRIGLKGRSDDQSLELSVANLGETLAPDELERLFDRFYRAPRAEAGTEPGLGLGLYITRGLVEAHGGRIHAESHEGLTVFRMTLPMRPRPSD